MKLPAAAAFILLVKFKDIAIRDLRGVRLRTRPAGTMPRHPRVLRPGWDSRFRETHAYWLQFPVRNLRVYALSGGRYLALLGPVFGRRGI
jgi:hypothetical protein